jgi:hypothetical protein
MDNKPVNPLPASKFFRVRTVGNYSSGNSGQT